MMLSKKYDFDRKRSSAYINIFYDINANEVIHFTISIASIKWKNGKIHFKGFK